jgi:hypothetical protein
MSTYANGTQQSYQQIWASMELTCAGLMTAIRSAAPAPANDVPQAPIGWPELAASSHVRQHLLRTPRRSARGRRKLAARIH